MDVVTVVEFVLKYGLGGVAIEITRRGLKGLREDMNKGFEGLKAVLSDHDKRITRLEHADTPSHLVGRADLPLGVEEGGD